MTDETANEIEEDSKPRLVALLFAEWGAETKSNTPALSGIFDRVFTHSGNDTPSMFYFYMRTVQTHLDNIEVKIIAPDRSEVGALIIEPSADPNLAAQPAPVIMQGISHIALTFNQLGVYWFKVFYKGESLGQAPLTVQVPPEIANVIH